MINEIKQMYEDGHVERRIAVKLNISEKEVKKIIEENNFELKKEKFENNRDVISYINKLYSENVSSIKLGEKFGVSKGKIQRLLDNMGVNLRTPKQAGKFYSFNEQVFNEIREDDFEKIYWLGFLYAHSHQHKQTNTFSICVAKNKEDQLDKLSKYLNSNYTYSKVGNSSVLNLISKYFCDKFEQIIYDNNDSEIKIYPKFLTNKNHNHFIRGLYDGGGSLRFHEKTYQWKFNIISDETTCEELVKIFFVLLNIEVKYESYSGAKYTKMIEIGSGRVACKLLSWLYDGSNESIRADEKYSKYLELVEYIK
jgi:hypothetical protein